MPDARFAVEYADGRFRISHACPDSYDWVRLHDVEVRMTEYDPATVIAYCGRCGWQQAIRLIADDEAVLYGAPHETGLGA